uniref:Protein kinase domain-containing protein n=1 Tax=Timema monikensis TaxID=170555 RepID=A0A7R9E1N0_9NEOP|nr:unnamed protein product [Timema monikensis]
MDMSAGSQIQMAPQGNLNSGQPVHSQDSNMSTDPLFPWVYIPVSILYSSPSLHPLLLPCLPIAPLPSSQSHNPSLDLHNFQSPSCSSHSDKEVDPNTPEKVPRTPSERKRKRKADDSGGVVALIPGGKGPRTADNKKINDYFNKHAGTSPIRHGGSKSPSPQQGYPMFPPSPQQTLLPSPVTPVTSVPPEFSSLMHLPRSLPVMASKLVQTELTCQRIQEFETQASSDLELRNNKIDELNRGCSFIAYVIQTTEELRHQLTAQQKVIDQHKLHINKCIDVVKKLLKEKSNIEKKEARQKCMQNRLRLGQFVTQRVGATFQENWTDGYAFQELSRRQEEITSEREEIDRQKKMLLKKRPSNSETGRKRNTGQQSQGSTTTTAILHNGTDATFLKPDPVPGFSWQEYYEADEILKLRQSALKKEDADLQLEMEKLERERNLHIRELKRIHNEDQSRFNNHPVLNERYLLLMLLGKGGFSEVHKAFDLKEQRYVACKVHQLNKDWKEDKKANYIKHALREYNIHKGLDHPRVVKLYDVFEIDANSFCTVLEYCDGHDLDFYLKQCKLAFCKTIADECQPFLQRFQTSKPMTPYLFEAVEKLLRYLMNRCVKPDLMKCTGPKLLSIDTKKSENLILSKNIDIGFATKRLLGETAITVTERQKLEFIHECRSMLTTMIAKLQEKSPLKQKAVRGLSSLDPCVIQHSPQLAQKRFSFLLEELNHANIINDVLAENAKKEYLHFCNLKKSELQEIFRPCDQFSDEVGLDTIYGSFLIGEANYKHLWEVIKICLVLSHGNATVEGGFSVNKSLLVENMHEKTVIAQRHIHDEIQEAGGIKNIHISKKMLDYVRGARKRYHEYLEMKKQEKSEKDKKKAEKRKLDIQVKDLEGERKKLMMATEEKREAIDVELQELKKKQASLY